jgi:hypothetical protein
MQAPIFEESVSALYYSNDGRLRLHVENPFSDDPIEYALRLDEGTANETEVFRTRDRIKIDAYIAGYDCGIEVPEEIRFKHEG